MIDLDAMTADEIFDLLHAGKISQADIIQTLFNGIMELSHDERKELLAMWKGRRKECGTV